MLQYRSWLARACLGTPLLWAIAVSADPAALVGTVIGQPGIVTTAGASRGVVTAPAMSQARPVAQAPISVSGMRAGVVQQETRPAAGSRIISADRPQAAVGRNVAQAVRNPAPQPLPEPNNARRTGVVSLLQDRRDDRGQDHRRRGFSYGNNGFYRQPGIYPTPGAGYSYPYLYVQSYGNPFAGAYLGTSEYVSPYVYPAAADKPAPPKPVTENAPLEPDSLVQDVQEELTRRGYFAGKATGLVSKDFQAALRRFQTDQQLVGSGLINQATLFALGLN